MAWISLIKWGSVIFFSHIIGFKDKLSLACTQQVCIYVWGEDLLSSSIALCRYKQEKKETWSRQKWIITTSDKHIQTAKSVGWTLARGTLISTRWHHLRAAATLFFRCLGLRYSCRLFWTLFFHTSPGYQKTNSLWTSTNADRAFKVFTPHILYSDWEFFTASPGGNGNTGVCFDVCYRPMWRGQGWLKDFSNSPLERPARYLTASCPTIHLHLTCKQYLKALKACEHTTVTR